jgi:hypothetical protein
METLHPSGLAPFSEVVIRMRIFILWKQGVAAPPRHKLVV